MYLFSGVTCSIIMLQKVAAKVNFVPASLDFRACEVRWLLRKKFLGIAAISAASLCRD